jgi:hypothetical protein
MNTVEPFLEQIRLQQILTVLNDKIDLDKEILLVYAHLKHEEKYLASNEPILPLFKRYSLGYERVIQIWRRKCSADRLLNEASIFLDSSNNADTSALMELLGHTNSFNDMSPTVRDFDDTTYIRLLKNIIQSNDVKPAGIERSLSGTYMGVRSRLLTFNVLFSFSQTPDNDIYASTSNISKINYNTLPSKHARKTARKSLSQKPSKQPE